MKTRIALLFLTVAASLLSGCTTTARKNTAMVAYQYGADVAVVDKLERGQSLTFYDIEDLGRRGVPDRVILSHLRRRSDTYRLNAAQVSRLREAGVGDPVINYLLESRERAAWRARRYPFYTHHHHSGNAGHGGAHHHGHGIGHH